MGLFSGIGKAFKKIGKGIGGAVSGFIGGGPLGLVANVAGGLLGSGGGGSVGKFLTGDKSGGFVDDPTGRNALKEFLNRDLDEGSADIVRNATVAGEQERALVNRRFANTAGFDNSAFGDSIVGAQIAGENNRIQNSLANLRQSNISQRLNAANALNTGNLQQQGILRNNQSKGILPDLLGAGASLGSAAILASSKDKKRRIRKADTRELLEMAKGIDVKKFRFRPGEPEDDGREHIGQIAEDAPNDISIAGKAIDVGDTIGMLLGAVQELNTKIEQLERLSGRVANKPNLTQGQGFKNPINIEDANFTELRRTA
jgi:hypothetical protein